MKPVSEDAREDAQVKAPAFPLTDQLNGCNAEGAVMESGREVAIVGIGIHPFGRSEERIAVRMGEYAVRQALKDAGLEWKDIQVAYGGGLSGGWPQALEYYLGLTGIPFSTIINGCATAGSCILAAYKDIKYGRADTAIALGFDNHPRGAFAQDETIMASCGLDWYAEIGLTLSPQFFAMRIQRYMHQYGISTDSLIKVAIKASHCGALNPNAWRRKVKTYEEVASSVMVCHPLRQYMFCSPTAGAAAVVMCSSEVARRHTTKPVLVRGVALRTRLYGSFDVFTPFVPVKSAPNPTMLASSEVYEMAGLGPEDIDVAQVQDSDAGQEIMHMAECGFCKDGEQERLIQDGETGINGKMPINTDGGLQANGEPIGASGLRQVYEVCLQLRGDAGPRQVPRKVTTGFTHVYGAPGTSACVVLSR
jgi:acetyl-CoA acetyltransferase